MLKTPNFTNAAIIIRPFLTNKSVSFYVVSEKREHCFLIFFLISPVISVLGRPRAGQSSVKYTKQFNDRYERNVNKTNHRCMCYFESKTVKKYFTFVFGLDFLNTLKCHTQQSEI